MKPVRAFFRDKNTGELVETDPEKIGELMRAGYSVTITDKPTPPELEPPPLGKVYKSLMEKAGELLDAERPPEDWKEGRRMMELADRISDALATRITEGREHEKAGEIEEAIELYEACVRDEFHGTHPWERLRIIYTREKRCEDAIRVCETYMKQFGESADYRKKVEALRKKAEC